MLQTQRTQQPRVLIIEDNEVLRVLFFTILRHQPLAVDKFQSFLDQDLPVGVFPGKALLWVAESDARYIFHLVGKRFSLDETQWLGPRKNRLVLIGRNLDGEQLLRRLEACLAGS